MSETKLLPGIAVACSICLGCGADVTEEDLAVEEQAPIIGATLSDCSYPEVGILENTRTGMGCTASLVAPDMILSAAHCFDYGTNELGTFTDFRFRINSSCGTQSTFSIIRYKSFVGSEADDNASGRTNDVAIAQLLTSVPSPTASPMNFFGGGLPAVGTSVTDVGHGARTLTECSAKITDWHKGVIAYPLDVSGTNLRTLASPFTSTVCPGDSGGPVFTGPNRQIFWVNSAYNLTTSSTVGYSWYGEAWRLTTQIDDRMANWSCPSGKWWDNTAVNKDQRYPYARVCGMDRQNYECTPASHQWKAVGGTCGDTSCQCPNGSAFGNVAIAPDRTSCGSTVCGQDKLVYRCTLGGWQAEPGSQCAQPLRVTEDFSVMPAWTSLENAPWGGAAAWSIVSGGQSGNALRAVRTSIGSSARVKVYPVSPNTTYTASIYMKVVNSTADFWAEAAIKPGSFSATNFDQSSGTWQLIKKFDRTTNGNGNVWTRYQVTFNSGANTQVSAGFKLGNLSGAAPTVDWDTLRIQ